MSIEYTIEAWAEDGRYFKVYRAPDWKTSLTIAGRDLPVLRVDHLRDGGTHHIHTPEGVFTVYRYAGSTDHHEAWNPADGTRERLLRTPPRPPQPSRLRAEGESE